MAKQKLIRIKQSELTRLIDLLDNPKDERLKNKLDHYRKVKPTTLERVERHRIFET
ncbi:hypothetical protein [uncultured Endozoicomonas sp.]|uniref:hypothetical protein n=1 Tax=uncultured Endozoicomonas sp. TaxID=432652 RepID=UPI002621979D|nr:hypothetical protein [uncultured Endozoicomonas sp.]